MSPGAKLGSTAPYAWSECVFLEAGAAQPRSLANAFRRPVDKTPDVLANAYDALAVHVAQFDEMYGPQTERRLSATGPAERLTESLKVEGVAPLADTSRWAADLVRG